MLSTLCLIAALPVATTARVPAPTRRARAEKEGMLQDAHGFRSLLSLVENRSARHLRLQKRDHCRAGAGLLRRHSARWLCQMMCGGRNRCVACSGNYLVFHRASVQMV